MKLGTRIIHGGHEIDPYTKGLSTPIYQVSTFAQESVDDFGRYDYARSATRPARPWRRPSPGLRTGRAASPLPRDGGDLFGAAPLFPRRPSGRLRGCLRRHLPGSDLPVQPARHRGDVRGRHGAGEHRGELQENTRGLFLETPSNPLLKITDLAGAAALARERGIVTLVDNTFMTPYFQRPLDLGCDIVLHSGTKFLNGHSDVICGFAVVRDPELAKRIRFIQNAFGAILGPRIRGWCCGGSRPSRCGWRRARGGLLPSSTGLTGRSG